MPRDDSVVVIFELHFICEFSFLCQRLLRLFNQLAIVLTNGVNGLTGKYQQQPAHHRIRTNRTARRIMFRLSSIGFSAEPIRVAEKTRLEHFSSVYEKPQSPLTLARCNGADVIEFLKCLDQFGKTKVHVPGCPFFGHPNSPAPCACSLRQVWGSLDALIGRLRTAYEESGGRPESNPFVAGVVRIYIREVREFQAKARDIPYKNKKGKRTTNIHTISDISFFKRFSIYNFSALFQK